MTRVKCYELALQEIADPIRFMRERAEAQGAVLNGFAVQIADDPSYLKNIAREVLQKFLAQ